jgi:hypothetical protein
MGAVVEEASSGTCSTPPAHMPDGTRFTCDQLPPPSRDCRPPETCELTTTMEKNICHQMLNWAAGAVKTATMAAATLQGCPIRARRSGSTREGPDPLAGVRFCWGRPWGARRRPCWAAHGGGCARGCDRGQAVAARRFSAMTRRCGQPAPACRWPGP